MSDESEDVGPPNTSCGGTKPRPVAALLAALLLSTGAVLSPSPAGASAGSDGSLVERVEAIRQLHLYERSRTSAASGPESEAPQTLARQVWGNWGNWGNWHNFNNWPNWGNWGNWVNV